MVAGRRDRHRGERGTASMEMLLTLPFYFLVLVLVVDMGYGWIYKMKTNTAARFAGTTYIRTEPGGDGRRAAEQALRTYYSALEIRRMEIDDRRRPDSLDNDDGGQSGWNRIADTLFGWLASISSRQSVELVVERRPPVGTIVSELPITTFFAVDGNTWTYDEVPLSISGLVDRVIEFGQAGNEGGGLLTGLFRIVSFFLGYVAKGFFWMLGMYP